MTDDIRHCRVCGVREALVSVAVLQGGCEQSRTFVCATCAGREEKLLFRDGRGFSLSRTALSVVERLARRAGSDPDKGCPLCGAALSDIVADGLLGCGYCYTRFGPEVAASMGAAQGCLQHLGKSPFG